MFIHCLKFHQIIHDTTASTHQQVPRTCKSDIVGVTSLTAINNWTNWFQTTSGVRQGCILAPALFSVAIDWILNHMSRKNFLDMWLRQFTDLVYGDDHLSSRLN